MKRNQDRFTPAVRNGRFECHIHEVKEGFFFCTASMLFKSLVTRLNPWRQEQIDWIEQDTPVERSEKLLITWIGHSTVLIQIGGVNILTDPIFGNASFLYPRITPPGIARHKLPPIDLVLISHNHYDHMEKTTIRELSRTHKTQFLVPQGNSSWFSTKQISRVIESMWWQEHIWEAVRCTFLPAVHWTQRTIFDRNQSLWGSWMIQFQDQCIYFAGDTAYGNHFSTIATAFPSIDIAILPIGPCEPREFMRHAHMNAQEAGEAFMHLGAKHFIPVHWGTFHFGNETAKLPIELLTNWWKMQSNAIMSDQLLHIPKIGKKLLFSI